MTTLPGVSSTHLTGPQAPRQDVRPELALAVVHHRQLGLLLMRLWNLRDAAVDIPDLLEYLEHLSLGAGEAPAHDCASDPGQAGVRLRETGGNHASVELSWPRKSDQPDVIDDVLIESLKFRMRNQIAPGHSEVLWLLETRGA